MKSSPPRLRRKFTGAWDEIRYLYDQLLYWLYQRQDPAKARRYTKQLEKLLRKADPNHEAIFGEECWSLLHEAKGDLASAIEHRKSEIRLIRRLHDVAGEAACRNAALQNCDYDHLSDRLDLLAALYFDNGELEKAITTLQDSKQLCVEHGIPFDGEEMLEDYLEEQAEAPQNGKLNGRHIRGNARLTSK